MTRLSRPANQWERAVSNWARSMPCAMRKQKSLRVGEARMATYWGVVVVVVVIVRNKETHGYEGSDQDGVERTKDLVVGSFETDLKIELGVGQHHGKGAMDIAISPQKSQRWMCVCGCEWECT